MPEVAGLSLKCFALPVRGGGGPPGGPPSPKADEGGVSIALQLTGVVGGVAAWEPATVVPPASACEARPLGALACSVQEREREAGGRGGAQI